MAVFWSLTMAAKKSGALLTRASALGVLALAIVSAQPPPLKEFSHPKHLKLGNVAPVIAAAIDKGTYLGKNGAQIRPLLNSTNQCEACHRGLQDSEKVSRANMPQMADCLVCHNEADIHPLNILDTHTKKNAIVDKESCAVCHGRKFTCLGCHLK
jgi:hypothetical protein